MRLLSKLHVCAGATILMVLYFTWTHHSAYFESHLQAVWKGYTRRIVVFGDDWSDTGSYRVAPAPLSTTGPRDTDQGDPWVVTLCKELACNTIDNFARSVPSNAETAIAGCLVDSDTHAEAKTGDDTHSKLTSFDFKTQVRQFITYDKGARFIPGRLRKVDELTIFTVFFGLWDLLGYAKLQTDSATQAIDNSITQLFRQLDVLVEHTGGPITVIMPTLIDVTFLPRVQSTRSSTQEHFAENQHHLVFLWTYWNTALLRSASQWKNGEISMPDSNGLIMDQVLLKQLPSENITDASGSEDQAPLFQDVEQPCLVSKQGTDATDLQAADIEKCINPAQHLFWDDIHLSGPAHELIGKEAASLLHGNYTVNIDPTTQGFADGGANHGQDGEKFNLKFPPGY